MATYTPSPNAPIYADCDLPLCTEQATFDTFINAIGTWGYLCTRHFIVMGSADPALATNLTEEPITINLGS